MVFTTPPRAVVLTDPDEKILEEPNLQWAMVNMESCRQRGDDLDTNLSGYAVVRTVVKLNIFSDLEKVAWGPRSGATWRISFTWRAAVDVTAGLDWRAVVVGILQVHEVVSFNSNGKEGLVAQVVLKDTPGYELEGWIKNAQGQSWPSWVQQFAVSPRAATDGTPFYLLKVQMTPTCPFLEEARQACEDQAKARVQTDEILASVTENARLALEREMMNLRAGIEVVGVSTSEIFTGKKDDAIDSLRYAVMVDGREVKPFGGFDAASSDVVAGRVKPSLGARVVEGRLLSATLEINGQNPNLKSLVLLAQVDGETMPPLRVRTRYFVPFDFKSGNNFAVGEAVDVIIDGNEYRIRAPKGVYDGAADKNWRAEYGRMFGESERALPEPKESSFHEDGPLAGMPKRRLDLD